MDDDPRPAKRMRLEIIEDLCLPVEEMWDSVSNNKQEGIECCYGMLCDIAVKTRPGLNLSSNTIPVKFHSPGHLSSMLDLDSIIFDIPYSLSANILVELENETTIETQLYCHSKDQLRHEGNLRQRGRHRISSRSWFLNIIIFGPNRMMEEIGEYLSNKTMYLQDPIGCERCVPYRNPHAVTWGPDDIVMADSFNSTVGNLEIEELRLGPDLLAQLMKDEIPLEETEAPGIVKTALFRLTDLASIVRFLRVYPYSDKQTFIDEILRPFQNCSTSNAQGFLRLKTLVRAITISRTKAVVHLPPRIDEIHHLNFTAVEREKYENEKIQANRLLEEAISSGNPIGKTFNRLSLLNRLRLICNHGILDFNSENESSQNSQDAESCSLCGLYLLGDTFGGLSSANICEQCSSQKGNSGRQSQNSNQEFLDIIGISTPATPATPVRDGDAAFRLKYMSTKIKALIADLDKHNPTEKRSQSIFKPLKTVPKLTFDSVIFSYWTHTLDLVQLMLKDRVQYTRIDGNMTLSKRNEALQAFKCNDSVRVILVSITCGGAGLDLTTGSRAYLLEPQWNPMIEEQALCRVHRVGQQKNVTTIRYLMRDSFEEQVVEVQKKKKMLSQITFAQGPLSEADIDIEVLKYLKSVLG
ncbi:hypothetical protein NHQ30_010958 [Ciborinia camelliae]|nr:hypothetical protein NHQ30_010958 [Ciborinia camelliae]